MKPVRPHARGVSLIEALVALAVLAFGMLGLVGLQASMRTNADIAKQRAEATRIAQERVEAMRSYGSLVEYGAVVADVPTTPANGPVSTNTVYSITTDVTPDLLPANRPPLRTAVVTVAWEDRASQPQSVVLATQVAGVSPAVTGALATDGYGVPARRVYGRNAAIPPAAENQGDGTSRFTPPGASVAWVFDNASGLIVRLCDVATGVCTTANLALVSGYINFSTETDDDRPAQPTPRDAEQPRSGARTVQVRANVTTPAATVDCATDRQPLYVAYYCALPLFFAPNPPDYWSGFIGLRSVDGFRIADSASDDHDDRFRVCRYTPEDTDRPSGGNVAHPLNYVKVTTSLANQNFLVIRAGDDRNPYVCPDDDTSTPYVNGNTYAHQPATPTP